MLKIESFFYDRVENYSTRNIKKNGWAMLLTKIRLLTNELKVYLTLIDRSRIEYFIADEEKIEEIIVIHLELFDKKIRVAYPEIELHLTEDIQVLSHLLFSHFKLKDIEYPVDAAINMIQRKSFKKNEETLKRHFEIFKAIFFIQTNLCNGVSVEALAKHMSMSLTTIRRFCLKATHKTPAELIQDIRIAEAKDYLGNTDMSVDNIAEAVGFRQNTSLYTFFREKVGITPGEYRQMYHAILLEKGGSHNE